MGGMHFKFAEISWVCLLHSRLASFHGLEEDPIRLHQCAGLPSETSSAAPLIRPTVAEFIVS